MMSLRRGDEGLSTVARFQCVECAATYDLKVQSDKPINPEGYAKRAQQDGWKADPWKRNRCYCPRCAGPQKKMNDPNSELNKVVPLPVQPVPREITPEARQRIRNLLDKHFDDGEVLVFLAGPRDGVRFSDIGHLQAHRGLVIAVAQAVIKHQGLDGLHPPQCLEVGIADRVGL